VASPAEPFETRVHTSRGLPRFAMVSGSTHGGVLLRDTLKCRADAALPSGVERADNACVQPLLREKTFHVLKFAAGWSRERRRMPGHVSACRSKMQRTGQTRSFGTRSKGDCREAEGCAACTVLLFPLYGGLAKSILCSFAPPSLPRSIRMKQHSFQR